MEADTYTPAERRRLRRMREAAVKLDSQPEVLAAVERLRERLPGDRRFGDPLSTAGRTPVEVVAREASALQPARPSAAHGLGLAALQVWQALSERSGRGRGDEPVAILFTDLVGFSSWALEAGDAKAVELLREAGVVLESAVVQREGTIVKRLGDGLMAAFGHPQAAVDAVLVAHEGLTGIDVDGYEPRMRAGVHYGRPRKLGGDFLGVDVNIAARVGEAAGADELLVSEAACALLDVHTLDVGKSRRLKAEGAPSDLRVRQVARR